MDSLKQLEKEKARLLKQRKKQLKRKVEIQKRKDLTREIFLLKHGKQVDFVKRTGKSLQKSLTKAQKWAEKREGPPPKKRKENSLGMDVGSIW